MSKTTIALVKQDFNKVSPPLVGEVCGSGYGFAFYLTNRTAQRINNEK